jgi:hypothetical protein
LLVLVHQVRRDLEFTRLNALDLLAVPTDEALHRRVARQHQRQDRCGTLADDVGFCFALSLGRGTLLGLGDEPLAELLR